MVEGLMSGLVHVLELLVTGFPCCRCCVGWVQVELPTGLAVVPGPAAGEGCNVAGGCASCPFMKMNSLSVGGAGGGMEGKGEGKGEGGWRHMGSVRHSACACSAWCGAVRTPATSHSAGLLMHFPALGFSLAAQLPAGCSVRPHQAPACVAAWAMCACSLAACPAGAAHGV